MDDLHWNALQSRSSFSKTRISTAWGICSICNSETFCFGSTDEISGITVFHWWNIHSGTSPSKSQLRNGGIVCHVLIARPSALCFSVPKIRRREPLLLLSAPLRPLLRRRWCLKLQNLGSSKTPPAKLRKSRVLRGWHGSRLARLEKLGKTIGLPWAWADPESLAVSGSLKSWDSLHEFST